MKHLYRSIDNRIFSGILGGLGEYYNIDPVVLRAAYVLLTIMTGIIPCILAYFICTFIIPQRPLPPIHEAKVKDKAEPVDVANNN